MPRRAGPLCVRVGRDGQTADGGGVIARALAAERRRAASPALGVSAAALLLYLSTLELRAGEAAAVYAGRDVAGILAELMRRADFTAEEDVSAESRGDSKGARRRLLGETREDADAADETKNGNASSFGSGFGALLANGAEAKALRTTRDALRNLKFLPHESVDAPTLALLAAHRALAQTERAAARAARSAARRRVEAEKRAEARAADGHPADPRADHDSSPSEEREARRAEAEGDEAAVLGWSGFKESLAARGAVLETARLADEAAREICQAGARCFSRRETHETHIGEDENGDGGVEDDSTRAGRATARLFRCMRVVEAATFGSPSCADACVSGSLAPAPELYAKPPREPLRLVPMRVNDAIASPAPKSPKPSTVGGAGTMRDTRANADVVREAGDERALADVVRDTRVDGIELSPRASPDREAALKSRGADGDGGGSTGAKRRATEEEDAAATAKRFRTAEALLLTPSPGSKRFGGESRAGAVAGAIDAAGASFLVDEVTRDASRNGDARNGDASRTRTRRRGDAETRRGNVSAPRERAPAAETPTFNFSRVAAAVDASIAWLDDDKAGAVNVEGDARPWTMVHALLGAIPTLAAAAATAAHATDAGDFVCGVRTARAGGLGADPRLAAGTLRAVVCVLTNLTNENPAGCAAVRAAGGLETAAALIPWCAALEGLLPGAGPDAAARAAAAARGGVLEPKRATASRRAQTADANADGERGGPRHAQRGVVFPGERRRDGRRRAACLTRARGGRRRHGILRASPRRVSERRGDARASPRASRGRGWAALRRAASQTRRDARVRGEEEESRRDESRARLEARRARRAFGASLRARRRRRAYRRRFYRERNGGGGEAFRDDARFPRRRKKKGRVETVRARERRSDRRDARDRDARAEGRVAGSGSGIPRRAMGSSRKPTRRFWWRSWWRASPLCAPTCAARFPKTASPRSPACSSGSARSTSRSRASPRRAERRSRGSYDGYEAREVCVFGNVYTRRLNETHISYGQIVWRSK